MSKIMNANEEIKNRVEWIKSILSESGSDGIVYGNSGGKDCTLVGALCHMATENTTGIIMPCDSTRNYGRDRDDAILVSKHFNIKTLQVDLTPAKKAINEAIAPLLVGEDVSKERLTNANININPRLRMITVYAYAAAHNCLVAGTGNRSEASMGYFTKWGDGAHDFNPIADLTVTEVYELLRELGAPNSIIDKAPSAGLFEGQTDEGEMGISYKAIDDILLFDKGSEKDKEKVYKTLRNTEHKRNMPITYKKG